MSISIAVVFFSGWGHTARQAAAVAEGANASLIQIDAEGNLSDQQWEELDKADAIIMGSPTYMGSVSWQFKKFADTSSKRWFVQAWKDKVFGGFTNSAAMNGDKQTTIQLLQTLAMQHSGIWVGTGRQPAGTKAIQRDDINFMGSMSGLMIQTPSDAGVDEMASGDLETSRLYGARVAEITQKLRG